RACRPRCKRASQTTTHERSWMVDDHRSIPQRDTPAGGLGGSASHAPPDSKWIGRPMRRREDRPLVIGAGRYVDDLQPRGLCHVVFVRSPHAHARLASTRLDAARNAPGVVAVMTGADVADLAGTPVTRLFPDLVVPRAPLLVTDVARAQGTPVVAVVAESVYAAADAAALVDLEWEARPGVAEPDAAFAEGAPQLHADAPRNRCLGHRWKSGEM